MLSIRTILAFLVFVACAPMVERVLAEPTSSIDTDSDGIPDEWERRGHGFLLPSMVSVGRRDLIMYIIRRDVVSADVARASMERVKTSYRNLPIPNPDGSTGIFMQVIEGPELPMSHRDTAYDSLYLEFMPFEWRGIARGFIIGAGSGGQTASPDWATSGHAWQAIAHEIGHMLELNHTPPNQTGQGVSPLWTSIENYMYTYNFNGESDAVHFSRGQFSDITLNETRLSERINRPRAELSFLEQPPNSFRLETISDRVTGVDWNRNGRIDDGIISADINDGYSVVGKVPALIPGESSAGMSMSTIGDRVFLVYPRLEGSPAEWRTERMMGTVGARLQVHMYDGTAFSVEPSLLGTGVYSDVSSASFGNMLAVAYVGVKRRPYVGMWETNFMQPNGIGTRRMLDTDRREISDQAIVVAENIPGSLGLDRPRPCPPISSVDCLPVGDGATIGRSEFWVLSWNSTTKKVRIAEISQHRESSGSITYRLGVGRFADLPGSTGSLRSAGPVGAALDPLDGRLRIAIYGSSGDIRNALKVVEMQKVSGRWSFVNERFVGRADHPGTGSSAPVVVLNPTAPIGGRSQINIYARGVALLDALVPVIKFREIAGRAEDDGWRIKIMVDEWNTTQSPPAATRYRGTDLFALRWRYEDSRPNQIVFYTQTGILDEELRDHDDVRFIGETGLGFGLRRLRCYAEHDLGYNFELVPSECR